MGHAISGETAGRLFGRGASAVGQALEGCKAEPAAIVAWRSATEWIGAKRPEAAAWIARRLRDWVHRFNAQGPDGLIDNWTGGPKPRLSAGQLTEFAEMVETGPDPRIDGVARWRRIDLKRVIGSRFGVKFHECYVGKLLKKLGFSHMSAHPRHCGQAEGAIEDFKKPAAGCGPPVAGETGLIS